MRPNCTTSSIALRERAAQSTAVPVAAGGQRSAIWHFSDPIAVSIVCSDAKEPPPYSQSSHLNYSRYARYADLDALLEVFGRVKADNPARMIRILPTGRLGSGFCLERT